jgi:hypothetical protein
MIQSLVLLVDLLTNYQAVESLARDVFSFGLANTAIAILFVGYEIIRRIKLHRNQAALSRA